jgi:hypothetical protein
MICIPIGQKRRLLGFDHVFLACEKPLESVSRFRNNETGPIRFRSHIDSCFLDVSQSYNACLTLNCFEDCLQYRRALYHPLTFDLGDWSSALLPRAGSALVNVLGPDR